MSNGSNNNLSFAGTVNFLYLNLNFKFNNVEMMFLACTVAPGQRINSLENMFLRKLKQLKTSSGKETMTKWMCGVWHFYISNPHIVQWLWKVFILFSLPCSVRSVSITFFVAGGSVDSRWQQCWTNKDMQCLVPVGGTGEHDDCLTQELLFWGKGAGRHLWRCLSFWFKTKLTIRKQERLFIILHFLLFLH